MADKRTVLAFDGVKNYVNLGNKPEFKIQGQLTIEAWVYVEVPSGLGGILSNINSSTDTGYDLSVSSQGASFQLGWYYTLTHDYTVHNQWYHVAATYDGESMRLYIDGTELETNSKYTKGLTYRDIDLLLGLSNANGVYFKGKMSEVRLWKIARSQEEIRKDMHRRLTGKEADLVGYWPLDEGSGDIVHDKSPNGNHGTIVGTVSWAESDLSRPKNSSKVLSCDGTWVILRNRPQFKIQGQLTLETWIYVEKINGGWDGFFGNISTNGGWSGYGFRLYTPGNGLEFDIGGQSGYSLGCNYAPIPLKEWFHVAATFDGKTAKLYINGEEKAQKSGSESIRYFEHGLYLGVWHDYTGQYSFTGKMTEARLWKVVRSPEEIKANMQRRLTGKEPGLVGCWPLNEGAGSIAYDKSPNGFNGSVLHGSWGDLDSLELSSLEPPEESSANKTPEGNSNQTETTPTPQVEITHIFYKGVVKKTQSDEYVEITNQESKPADISGWQIASGIGRNKFFTFPAGTTLAAGQKIRVYTNEVHPETGGFSCGSKLSLWKDSGDEARLLDAKGNLVSGLAYDSKGNFTKTHATK